MENATKALLIAAAVLVAILIISLGLVVYNMSAQTVQSVDLSQQEVQAQNEQFERYLGDNRRGNQVNAMLSQVLTNNTTQTDAGRKVTVYWGADSSSVYLASSSTSSAKKVDTGKTYTVKEDRDAKTGLIMGIHIVQN